MSTHFFEIVFQDDDFDFERRDKAEEVLKEALTKAELGNVVGRGFGIEFYNIDVEVNDFDAGLALVRKVLRELDVAPSTIIHFYFVGQVELQQYPVYD